jgi:hypothetical protein
VFSCEEWRVFATATVNAPGWLRLTR